MSNILGSSVLVAPTDAVNDNMVIKPNELNIDAQGEIDPNCPEDSNGITPCIRFQPLVMFVGGARDPDLAPISGIFYPYNNAHEDRQDIGYAAWQTEKQIKALALHWMRRKQKVVLVGHSYGGDTVMDVARDLSTEGKELELVVTLDPVSRFGARTNQPKPSGVKTWLNVYVDYNAVQRGPPNRIAIAGGPWGYCPNADLNRTFSNGTGYEHAYADDMFAFYQSRVEAVQ